MSQLKLTKMYTPAEVAEVLQVEKNTVYRLIGRGEIIAKKIGRVYRIPYSSIAFTQTGLDFDLLQADAEDRRNLGEIEAALAQARQ